VLNVQWSTNQNGVFEFAMKEISMLATLIASRELKNWYFTMKFLSQHLYVNNTCTKFQGQKIHQKKYIQNLPICVAVKKNSLLPTLTTFQGLKIYFFAMKFLEQQVLYVNNIVSKFQGQKINTKKDIHNLPTCVVLRNNHRNHFTTANFDTLPKVEKFLIYYEIFYTIFFLYY